MIDLSVVIVNWNTREHLLRCLASIRASSGCLTTESIVVDNASSDDSVSAVRRLFPETTIIVNRLNLGFARANNIGIRASSGKYLGLVNSDTIAIDGCIARLHGYLESHPLVGVAGPRLLGPSGDVQRSTMGFPTLTNTLFRAVALDSLFPRSRLLGSYLMAYPPPRAIREVEVLNGAFWLIRREALEQVGLLDEGFFIYGEDIDLCRRLARRGWARIQHPGAVAIHFGGASSALQPARFFLEMQRANLRYWRKHHGRRGARRYSMLLALHHFLRLLGFALRCVAEEAPATLSRHKMRRSRSALGRLLGELLRGRRAWATS